MHSYWLKYSFFVYTQLNIKTVLFQTIQFSLSKGWFVGCFVLLNINLFGVI